MQFEHLSVVGLTMDERAILADAYVPDEWRRANECPARVIWAKAPANLDHQLMWIRQVSVPPTSAASAPSEQKLPPLRTINPEGHLYYAIERRFQQLTNEGATEEEKTLPSVSNITDIESYCSTFEELLNEERHALLLLFERYSQYNTVVSGILLQDASVQSSSCQLKIEGIADADPPVLPGDTMLVRSLTVPREPLELRATVMSVVRGKQQHTLTATWHPQYPPSACNVRFVPSPKPHINCLTALAWLASQPSSAMMPLLFPETAPILPQTSFPLPATLNVQQADFCRSVLRRTKTVEYDTLRGPLILTGPAGTGKTSCMLDAVRQVLALDDKARILVCTPSHTASDVVCRRLGQSLDRKQLFRLFDANRPLTNVPVEVLQWTHQDGDSGSFGFPADIKELLSFRVTVVTCQDASLLYRAGLTNQQLRERRKEFRDRLYSVCGAANLNVTLDGVDNPHFTHLFIDEAAQATEPETLIPLSVVVDTEPGVRKVEIALVGDPRQLSPNVYSHKASDAGLGQSWMERLLSRPIAALGGGQKHLLGPDLIDMDSWLEDTFRENLSVFLTLNYRGHSSFLMMPSSLFYFDKLRCAYNAPPSEEGPSSWCEKLRYIESLSTPVTMDPIDYLLLETIEIHKQFDWPIHCRGVVGQDSTVTVNTGMASNSWQNEQEALVVRDIVVELTRNNLLTQSIGVMAPFRGQVVLIRRLLREKNLGSVDVGTIEDYQAVERDVIVLSLTRSTWSFVDHDIQRRMGVFGQPKRSNVALTRAEHLFLVVGHPDTMMKDAVWRQFVLFSLRNGLYYGHGPTLTSDPVQLVRCRPEDNGNHSDYIVMSTLERRARGHEE